MTDKEAQTRLLEITLADYTSKNDEIRERTGHEHQAYLTYFSTFVTIALAAVAADKLGILLSSVFQSFLPLIFLGIGVLALWLPLNEINEQFRIRMLAVYIDRRLVPELLRLTKRDIHDEKVLSWEPFQSGLFLQARAASWFTALLLVFRGGVSYAPALVAVIYGLGSNALAIQFWPSVLLLGLWLLVAIVPIACALYISRSKTLSLDVSMRS